MTLTLLQEKNTKSHRTSAETHHWMLLHSRSIMYALFPRDHERLPPNEKLHAKVYEQS